MNWNEDNPAVRSARRIVERLREAGCEALWVGGCVRDALLGTDPHDVDVATDAPPGKVQELFPKHAAVGAHFGVILVLGEEAQIEVATFRTDGEYVDARRPIRVTFGSAREDAERRDFTINALFYDPAEDRVIDFVGGRKDLDARVLRAIGDPAQRFAEDALRLLRAVRFAVRFELKIEPATFAAIQANARRIEQISAERIREELVRLFTGPRPGQGLRLLDEAGLLVHVLPELASLKGVPQPEEFHPEGDVFVHTALALDAMPPDPSPTLAFGVLLHDVGKAPTFEHADRIRFNRHHVVGTEMAKIVCRRLRFSNADRKQIAALVRLHMRFLDVQDMRPARLRRFLATERFDEHLALHRVDCQASHGSLENYDFCMRRIEEFAREDSEPLMPPPVLNGHDLIAAGYAPGPRMGAILRALREAQLNGEVDSRESALDWVRRNYPPEKAENASRSG
ncbi:MAG TPA: CCA tRNA nucleotidyltransferase [Sumerlaeia bacterium]|nr:CCA tRNA nucleotidyltransferase [Sumerlaeia bacterium]